MKKFDKAVGSRYIKNDDQINFKTPAKSRRHIFHFYWKDKRIIKDCAYSGWADLVNDILKTNNITTESYFNYSLRFMDKFNSFATMLNYPIMLYNNYNYKISVHYDSDVIEDMLKPSRVIIRWNNGFNHCINLNKEKGTFAEYQQDDVENYKTNGFFVDVREYSFTRGDVFIEHGITDQSKAIKALLRTRYEDIPDEYKVGVTPETMDYDSLWLLFEMSTI
jgi:hypothetical protein